MQLPVKTARFWNSVYWCTGGDICGCHQQIWWSDINKGGCASLLMTPVASHARCAIVKPTATMCIQSYASSRMKRASCWICCSGWNAIRQISCFLFIVKASALKQQVWKFHPQSLPTESTFYVYYRPWAVCVCDRKSALQHNRSGVIRVVRLHVKNHDGIVGA